MAALPALRVKSNPPFTVTGVDYTGPLYCLDFQNTKFYIPLFTCAVIRAVHLELVNSLSLKDFMLAIRGMPSVIFSDNTKTFLAAQIQIQKIYEHRSPEWRLQCPVLHGGVVDGSIL